MNAVVLVSFTILCAISSHTNEALSCYSCEYGFTRDYETARLVYETDPANNTLWDCSKIRTTAVGKFAAECTSVRDPFYAKVEREVCGLEELALQQDKTGNKKKRVKRFIQFLSTGVKEALSVIDVIGTVLGITDFTLGRISDQEEEKKFQVIMKKLDEIHSKLDSLALTSEYTATEKKILNCYTLFQNLVREKNIKDKEYVKGQFLDYYKAHYALAGDDLYNGIYKIKIFGQKLFQNLPENQTQCYNLHESVSVLLDKAALVELSHTIYHEKSTANISKKTANKWLIRTVKFKEDKIELCEKYMQKCT